MESIYNLQKRAGTLRRQTDTDSITPEDVGGLQYDTLAYIATMEQNAGSLGIRKVYRSCAEMEPDTTPVGTNGKELRFGQLVCIYDNNNPTAPDSGDIYAFQNPGWLLIGNISNISTLQNNIDSLRTWIEDNRKDIDGLGKGIVGLGADRNLPYRFLPGWDTETPGNFSDWELVSAALDKLNGGADDANRSGWYRGLLNGAPFDVRVFERGYANNDWTQVISGPVSVAGGSLASGAEFAILRRNCSKGVWEPWEDVIAVLKAELKGISDDALMKSQGGTILKPLNITSLGCQGGIIIDEKKDIHVINEPTEDDHAVPKRYVDKVAGKAANALQGATARFAGIKEPPEDCEYETETADLSPERIFYVPSHRCFRGLYGSIVFTSWTTEELYNHRTEKNLPLPYKDKIYIQGRHLYLWNEEEQTLTPITNDCGGELADGSVTTRKLADGAVTLTKIAPCAFATASEVLEVINK
ncbi:hypothetical protein E5358_04765 [Palleniella muris]|uniref:Uncharacterized protein n=1 Tax=Palleniella muris TaxID=3038145 RepID=A0AC61QRY8_9BACT|nr:hypothetical protein [Palleniella muris]TGX82976.1 hypothetical protein E5358_04765 [Palleniella muris]